MNEADFNTIWMERFGGWTVIFLCCLLPVLTLIFQDGFWGEGPAGVASAIGKLAGIIGFILYAINMVLSVRRRWLERFFTGLNRVYIAHHLTGAIALILLTIHPLFHAIGLISLDALVTLKYAAHTLLPQAVNFDGSFSEVQQQVAINNGFIGYTGLVTLLVLTFFIKLPYRVWLFTHKFLGPAFFFATLHVVFIDSDVARSPFLKGYVIFWAVVGLSAFLYRTIFGSVFVKRYPAQVVAVEKPSEDVIALDLQMIDEQMDFQAGQFVFIRFNWQKKRGVLPESHPFSIASAPEEGVVRVISKAIGDHTKAMLAIPEGTIAEIEGAFGRFMYQRFPHTEQIWIAGGIGITPFIGMAKTLTAESPKVHLFYSVVNRSELIGHKTFTEINPKMGDKFGYTPYVTSETKGFLSADYIAEQAGGLEGKEIFLCGPPPMMKAIKKQLKAKGVKAINIHSEEFNMS